MRKFLPKITPLALLIAGLAFTSLDALAESSRNAGGLLLESFQCDAKGSLTQDVIDSINHTKSLAKAINDEEQECKDASNALSAVPDISKALAGLQMTQSAADILAQQRIINDGLSELAYINSLPAGSPQLALYPSPDQLQATIQNARDAILTDQTNEQMTQTNISIAQKTDGLIQLKQASDSIALALKGNEKCFKKKPMIRSAIVTALVGISGFFMSSPYGIATAIGGSILQGLFKNMSTAKNRLNTSFDVADLNMLALGISCGYEYLGKQHCSLIRKNELFKANQSLSAKENPLVLTKAMQRDLIESEKRIELWVNSTSVMQQDPVMMTSLLEAKKLYQNAVDSFKTELLSLEGKQRTSHTKGGPSQSADLLGHMGSFLAMITPYIGGYSEEGDTGMGASYLHALFGLDEQYEDVLLLLSNNSTANINLFSDLKSEFTKRIKADQPTTAADTIAKKSKSALLMLTILQASPRETWGPITVNLMAQLESADIITTIRTNLIALEQKMALATAITLSPEQIDAATASYLLSENPESPQMSASSALIKIDHILQTSIKNDNATILKSGISDLADLINKAVQKTKKVRTAEPIASIDEKRELIADVNKIVGKNHELLTRLQTFLKYKSAEGYNSEIASEMKQYLGIQNQNTKNGNSILRSLLLLNKQTVESTLSYLSNPSIMQAQLTSAIDLSAAHIDGFEQFSKPYLNYVFKLYDGKNSKGKALSSGVLENMSPASQSRFCIDALAMTDLTDTIKDRCKGKILSSPSGNTRVSFDRYVGLPQPERSCAYSNFLTQERLEHEGILMSTQD